MAAIARLVFVRGRVQGVGFRWFVRERAEAHGVQGWVRNRHDGSVEAWLEGEPAAISALLADLRRGSRASRVDGLDERERTLEGHASFDFRPTA
jgi:acylphosphatase